MSVADEDGGRGSDARFAVHVLTPAEAIEELIDAVNELKDRGSLPGNSLTQQLGKVRDKLVDGKTAPAANQLRGFINHVESLVDDGVLGQAEGQLLIDAANRVLDSLQ